METKDLFYICFQYGFTFEFIEKLPLSILKVMLAMAVKEGDYMAYSMDILIEDYGPIRFYSIDNGRSWHFVFTEDILTES
jgi:hypothetical protein